MLKAAPRYHQPANAVIRPDRVTVQTVYFHERWLPELGPERAVLVITLRRLVREVEAEQGHNNEGPSDSQQESAPLYALHITSGELAERLGMTAKQVQRLLKSRPLADSKSWRELDPQQERAYKKYEIAQIQALQHFIPRLRYDYQPNPDTGRPERCGYVLEIAMDEPLTPADRVALNAEIGVKDVPNANFGVETPACNPQFWRSGPLNAKIGAQPSGNLSVTGANAPGAADAATASASPAHSLEQVAADLSQTTADEAGTAKAEPQPCSPRTGQPTQPSTKTVDLDLPLAELRARALADLERVRGRSSQTAIVAQFIGRLLGLGRDAEGLLRSTPDRGAGDYARVGELCRDFGPASVLTQVFAIAGRVPDDARDPLAYLRSSLAHKRRRRQRARERATASATSETPGDPLDQLTFADYREVPSETGGGA